jgi:hypothetical protein
VIRAGFGFKKKALLFLQKKKQKNSYLLRVVAAIRQRTPANKGFLLLFFKKEGLAFISMGQGR